MIGPLLSFFSFFNLIVLFFRELVGINFSQDLKNHYLMFVRSVFVVSKATRTRGKPFFSGSGSRDVAFYNLNHLPAHRLFLLSENHKPKLLKIDYRNIQVDGQACVLIVSLAVFARASGFKSSCFSKLTV